MRVRGLLLALAVVAALLTPVAADPPGGSWTSYSAGGFAVDRSGGVFHRPRLLWRSTSLDGDVYARPLVAHGRVYVATQGPSLYALDAGTGRVAWRVHYGRAVPRSMLPCGNVDETGFLSTPVLDPSGQRLYAVAFVRPGVHQFVAVDTRTGHVVAHHAVDPPGANPLVEQQRSALSYANGRVYVSYGGLYGDCGDYHGWVVAVDPATGRITSHYRVPSVRMAGIWGPGGAAVDAAGDLYVATGNSESTTRFDYGNAVIRLSPDLQVRDWFAAPDWVELNRDDMDIGSVGPQLLGDGLLFQSGKSGRGYLLRIGHLGHVGGQAFSAEVGGSVFGGTAYAAPFLYVSCANGLVALRVDVRQPSFARAWRAAGDSPGAPLVSHGAVWTITRDGSLRAFDLRSGRALFASPIGEVMHFAAPSAAGGRIFAPGARRVSAYAF